VIRYGTFAIGEAVGDGVGAPPAGGSSPSPPRARPRPRRRCAVPSRPASCGRAAPACVPSRRAGWLPARL